MGKKHLLPPEHDEYLDRLGLTEIDKKVYIATLDSGLVSIGELEQLTEINDLSKILDSVRDLTDIGILKQAKGRMPRYYAILPFLRETITVEREFVFALESMKNAVLQTRKKIKMNREDVTAYDFPNLIQELLDYYYKDILSPTLKKFEQIRDNVDTNLVDFIRDIQLNNGELIEEILYMIKPYLEFTDTFIKTANMIISSFEENINNIYENLNRENENNSNSFKTEVDEGLQYTLETITNIEKSIISSVTPLKIINSSLKVLQKEIKNTKPHLENSIEKLNKSKDDFFAELIIARQKLVKLAETEIVDEETQSVKKRGVTAEEIESTFSEIMTNLKKIEFNPREVLDTYNSDLDVIFQGVNMTNDIYNNLISDIELHFKRVKSEFKSIKNKLNELENGRNEIIKKGINELNTSISENSGKLRDALNSEEQKLKDEINRHSDKIKKTHDKVFSIWEEKMVELFTKPKDVITPVIENWVTNIDAVVDNFKVNTDKMLDTILEPLSQLEEETINSLIERIKLLKTLVQGRNRDLESINKIAKSFDYTKTSDTWVMVGLPSIYASITDLLLRSRNKVTVITPNLDLKLLEIAMTMKRTRVTFVTDIDKDKDRRIIDRASEVGRITFRAYDKKDLFACMRDSEELVFGFMRMDEDTVGIRTATPSIVELLEDRLNETIIRNSKKIS